MQRKRYSAHVRNSLGLTWVGILLHACSVSMRDNMRWMREVDAWRSAWSSNWEYGVNMGLAWRQATLRLIARLVRVVVERPSRMCWVSKLGCRLVIARILLYTLREAPRARVELIINTS
ncbi:hypothetical protein IWW43_004442 [Coemansia sp. RSA 1935]|nr:hypothetical protein IWW43_004442 [Coemansia sp. RSA 1935]